MPVDAINSIGIATATRYVKSVEMLAMRRVRLEPLPMERILAIAAATNPMANDQAVTAVASGPPRGQMNSTAKVARHMSEMASEKSDVEIRHVMIGSNA